MIEPRLYRKKPVTVDAIQITGDNLDAVSEFTKGFSERRSIYNDVDNSFEEGFVIKTAEGRMTARVGDWIIKGLVGEFYPCQNHIFKASYSEVNAGETTPLFDMDGNKL